MIDGKPYRPLVAVVAVCLASALAMPGEVMPHFMAFVFIIFSLFKFIDLPGFAAGLKKYDLIAQRFPIYATVFPFIELALGLGYLAFGSILPLNILAFVFTTLNAGIVIRALSKGLDVRCACLGTVLNVPLSTVSIIENVLMALMALGMIVGA